MRTEPNGFVQAVEQALRWLRARDYSCSEMSRRLREKGFPDTVVEAVIDWLVAERWLSDARLSQRLLERFCEQEPSGIARIVHEFERRGLAPPSEIPCDEVSRAIKALQKRFGTLPPESDARTRVRWYRFLIQRGFDPEVAMSALHQWNPALEDDTLLSGG